MHAFTRSLTSVVIAALLLSSEFVKLHLCFWVPQVRQPIYLRNSGSVLILPMILCRDIVQTACDSH